MLNPLTKNKYTVKDSFQFAEEISEQYPVLAMGSLDVDSLFTNILLDEIIDICINQFALILQLASWCSGYHYCIISFN